MTNVDSKLNDYMHAWGARSVPFHDEEKQQLFETEHTRQAVERLQQSAALRSVMLLSGDNGVGKSALVASWVRSLEPKAYRPLTITQASLSASGVLCALLAKLGQVPGYQRAVNISRMEDAIGHLGSVIPVIILDEAQNTTPTQMKMFLTRLGENSRMVVTGDLSQIDLPFGAKSGLRDATDTLKGVKGISYVEFTAADVVRHPLVTRIVHAYNRKEGPLISEDNKQ